MANLARSEKKLYLDYLNLYAKSAFLTKIESEVEKFEEGTLHQKDRFYSYKPVKVMNVGFDTEDDSAGNCHLLTFYITDKTYYEFLDVESALLWLTFADFKKDMIIVWCVNTEYDLNNLSQDYPYLVNRLYGGSRLIMSRMTFNTKVRCYDVTNFFSRNAAWVGKTFGMEKLDYDFKRKHRKDGSVIVSKKERTYCLRDAKIAWSGGNFISDQLKQWDIRQTPTVASCALQIWLRNFDPIGFNQYNPHRFDVPIRDLYASYYGGRTEPFYYGTIKADNIHYYDINSLYPFVMKKYEYPNPYSPAIKRRTVRVKNGIICATVTVPKRMHIPPLPYRLYKTKKNYKLVFPVGTFTGTWCLPELQNAIDWGVTVDKIHYAYEYSEIVDLFSEYVDTFYELRQKTKTQANREFYKIVMNGLYGKFAERRRIVHHVPIEHGGQFDPVVNSEWAQVTSVDYPIHNNVIVSSYVTAYARVTLYNWIRWLMSNGCRILYCDTDSIIYQGDFEIEVGTDLGEMKRESKIIEAEFLGPKYYRYVTDKNEEVFICKGVPKNVQYQMFIGERKASYRSPVRYREALRRKLRANVWYEKEKRTLTQFDKRRIFDNETRPLIIRG